MPRLSLAFALFLAAGAAALAAVGPRTADLDIGEARKVTLHDGSVAMVRVVRIDERRESVTHTLEQAVVVVEVNGVRGEVHCGNYRLPILLGGVQVDAPAVHGLMADSNFDWWQLKKDVRLRFWPEQSPWVEPGSFGYPVRQKWFASTTWFSNEPVSRRPRPAGNVYYHAGMDIGAAEGVAEVVAATDGVILTLGTESAPGKPHPAAKPRYDVIYVEDGRGWVYRYSHLMAFDPALRVAGRIKQGQRLGYVGKEGSSGGWTHLHFHVESLQPSGQWGVEDSYAFLLQAYCERYDPPVLAVARPHRKVLVGENVTLDASLSWVKSGRPRFEWTLMDGTTASGPTVQRTYDRPGVYSEIVKVTDAAGNLSYDFAQVRVYTGAAADGSAAIVTLHAAYAPTFGIRPGDPVLFRSRAFGTQRGMDVFDFGDGTPKVPVPSNLDAAQHAANGYGAVVHHYREPGHYLVRVERRDEDTGAVAVQFLHVLVER